MDAEPGLRNEDESRLGRLDSPRHRGGYGETKSFRAWGQGMLGLVWAELLYGRFRGGLRLRCQRSRCWKSYAAWGWLFSALEKPDVCILLRCGELRGSGDPAPLGAGSSWICCVVSFG